jgi:hypothetical protein
MLYAMHYFMGRLITFTKTSAVDAVTNLRSPALLPYIPTLTSTLLNLQIKKAMNSLLFEFTRDVLDGLGHLFAACRKQPFWAEAFCVVLILCMCMEELQMSIDSYVMAALRKDPSRALHSASILRGLDDRVFRHITELFHMAYKTARSSLSRTKRLGFNPIRDGFPLNESKGVTPQMTILVQDVRQIIKQCGKDTL